MTDQFQEQDVELDEFENEGIDEAHDPKDGAKKSAEVVDKAMDAGPGQAPTRTGDKRNSEAMPKTKAGMMAAIVNKMGGMPKTDIASAYKNMFGEEVEMEEEAIAEAPELDVNAELNDLVENEATLSEEFKEKTAILFETALASKIAEEVNRLEEKYTEELAEEVKTIQENMVEKIDGYLNYVVENWMRENELAIQNGLRTEIAEDFMNGLKNLFLESYIEVPDSKVDLVDDLSEQVEELEAQLNESIANSIALTEAVEELQRDRILSEASRGLAETQAEKLSSLVERVEFEDAESFAKKVATIKESIFSKAVNDHPLEEAVETDDTVETSSVMEGYLAAISRQIKK